MDKNVADWFEAYYEVMFGKGPIVICDDWTEPVDEVWFSYVVIPQPD